MKSDQEYDALMQENGVLKNALRRLLISCGVLNTDTTPNGPELVMATEAYLASKGELKPIIVKSVTRQWPTIEI